MCYEAELSLDSTPASVRAGRAFIADTLVRWGVTSDGQASRRADEIVLVASELLTNAVRASHGTAIVRIAGHRDHVVIAVHDDSPSPAPALAPRAPASATSGRGLAIVERLSDRWGTTPTGKSGKDVWSKMSIAAPLSLIAHCRL